MIFRLLKDSACYSCKKGSGLLFKTKYRRKQILLLWNPLQAYFFCEKALKSRLFRFTVDQGGSAGRLKGKLLQIFECWPLKIWYRLAMLDGWLLKIVTSQLSGWCSKAGTALGIFSGIAKVVGDWFVWLTGCVKVLNSIQISIRMEGHLKHQLN